MKFTKMHGLGNDYIYFNCLETPLNHPEELAVRLSRPHVGVGADGIILIRPSETGDFRMDMYNADGSRGEMCGNGIRCVGKYVYDKGLTKKVQLTIETLAGLKTLFLSVEQGRVDQVTVDMGEPVLEPEKIPVAAAGTRFLSQPVTVEDTIYLVTCVSMGNPHAVTFLSDIAGLPLERIGPKFERHPLFPCRTNTEFVHIEDRETLSMRVWERGSGETRACGTGACAAVVAGVL
ncbi:MAG: diaminopimelate epimerase, partial [Oscillospiraceae bacterium]|nr:diaminopimelate epimerase [Oscillospiraceae bacterium]